MDKKSQLKKYYFLVILLGVTLLFVSGSDIMAQQSKSIKKSTIKTEYTYNAQIEEYSDNTGNVIIYSKMRYADSSGTLIEDAPSLRDCEFCDKIKLNIKEDKDYPVEIIDYNYSSITLNLGINNKGSLGKDIDLKVYNKNDESKEAYNSPKKIDNLADKSSVTLPFGFDKEVKWGENSTTLFIKGSEGGLLEDADMSAVLPNNNYGSCTSLNVRGPTSTATFLMKWNISDLPIGESIKINNATLGLYGQEWLDPGDSMNVFVNLVLDTFKVDGVSWIEGGDCSAAATTGEINYNEQPGDSEINQTPDSNHVVYDGDSAGYIILNVTSSVRRAFSSGWENLSLWVNHSQAGGDITGDYIAIQSKEGTSSQLPFLNITYEYIYYNLTITSPTTASPDTVNPSDKLTVRFNLTESGDSLTSDVTQENVTIGGDICPPVQNSECDGTPDACSTYTEQGTCENTTCEWTEGEASEWVLVGMVNESVNPVSTKQIDLPAGTGEGSLVIVAVSSDDYGLDNVLINTADYIQIYTSSDANPFDNVSYKVMGASPDTQIEIETLDGGSYDRGAGVVIQVWNGTNTSSPLNSATPTVTSSSGGMPNAPSFTPSKDGTLFVIVGMLDDDSVASSVTAPAGFGNLSASEEGASGSVGTTVMMASFIQASAGGVDAAAFGGSGSDAWDAVAFAFDLGPNSPNTCTGTPNPCSDYGSGNCTDFGCDWSTINEFVYNTPLEIWELNCTVPAGCTGESDLFINATYDGNTYNETQVDAVDCGGADTCTFPAINLNHVIENGDVCTKTNQKVDMGTGNLTITEDSRLVLVDSNLTTNRFIPNATTVGIRIFNFSCSTSKLCYFNVSGLAE